MSNSNRKSNSIWDPMDRSPATLLCPWDFPRQESWSGLPFPFPGNIPNPGIDPTFPALAGGFFTIEPLGKAYYLGNYPTNLMALGVNPVSIWWLWWLHTIRFLPFVYKFIMAFEVFEFCFLHFPCFFFSSVTIFFSPDVSGLLLSGPQSSFF